MDFARLLDIYIDTYSPSFIWLQIIMRKLRDIEYSKLQMFEALSVLFSCVALTTTKALTPSQAIDSTALRGGTVHCM